MGEELFARGEFSEAFRLALPCAQEGDVDAEFMIALMIESDETGEITGLAESVRDREALFWLTRAAEHGNREAAAMIADSYENGWLGLVKDTSRAECWRAVEVGKERSAACEKLDPDLLEIRRRKSLLSKE